MARHHASKKHGHKKHHEHITKHDREIDRENLMHGHKAKHHSHHSKHDDPPKGHHKMMHHDGQSSYGMISEDMSAPANLPRNVVERYWPEGHHYMEGQVPDLFMGVQKQLNEDGMDLRREMKPKKY